MSSDGEDGCCCAVLQSSIEFDSGVGGGVSGLTRFDKTGNARCCGGKVANNRLNAALLAFLKNGCYCQHFNMGWGVH